MWGGLCVLVVLANVVHMNSALAWSLLLIYMGVGVLIIGNYCVAHEDEIPTRAQRRRARRR
jgi:hypothetical protein